MYILSEHGERHMLRIVTDYIMDTIIESFQSITHSRKIPDLISTKY